MRKLNNVVITLIIIQLFLYPTYIYASENDNIPKNDYSIKDTYFYDFGDFNVNSKRWVHYATNGFDYMFFYDKKSVTKLNRIVKVWTKCFGPKAMKDISGNTVTYTLGIWKKADTLHEINCKTRTKRELEWKIIHWNGKYDQSTGVTKWENIAPETLEEALFEKVCK